MTALNSSNLAAVDYAFGTLLVAFHGGRVYRYSGVPEDTYRGLLHAVSHGKYFWAHIRNRFPYVRVR